MLKPIVKKTLLVSALTLALSAVGQILVPMPPSPASRIGTPASPPMLPATPLVTVRPVTGWGGSASNGGATVVPGSFLNGAGSPNVGAVGSMGGGAGTGMGVTTGNMGVAGGRASPPMSEDYIMGGGAGTDYIMGGSRAESAPPETARLFINSWLRQALQQGLSLEEFIAFAMQNGASVSDISRVLLESRTVSVQVALIALGRVFSKDPESLTIVFAEAITVPGITLTPSDVKSAMEAGCGTDCLPASAISRANGNGSELEPPPPIAVYSLPFSTISNATSSGAGSGMARPISPSS